MDDKRDALLVVGDAHAIGAVALDAERLLGEHSARIDGVHVREQQDLLRAGAGKRGAHHLADLLGRVLHLVDVARLDQLDLPAQRLQAAGNELGDPLKALEVAAAGFDRHQRFQRLEQGLLLFLGQREHPFVRLGMRRRNRRGGQQHRGEPQLGEGGHQRLRQAAVRLPNFCKFAFCAALRGGSLNSRAAVPPRMLCFAFSDTNGRSQIVDGRSKSQCG